MKKLTHKENQGITLVALVITIIVLIILAAVSINAVMNDGLITNAKDAAKTSDVENLKEQAKIAYLDYQVKSELGQAGNTTMQKYVKHKLVEQGFSEEEVRTIRITDNGDIVEKLSENSEEVAQFVAAMDNSLIYNAGYITGLVDVANSAMYTKTTLLAKLPEGADILDYNGNAIADTKVISTGCRIVNAQGNIIAYTVFFGDTDGDGRVNIRDSAKIGNALPGEGNGYEYFYLDYVYADLNADGVVNDSDRTFISDGLMSGWAPPYYNLGEGVMVIEQFRTVTPNIQVINDIPT